MSDDVILEGMNSREAVEEIAHEIRTRQLNILGLVYLLRQIESGDLDAHALSERLDGAGGLDSIQQSVHEISYLIDQLVDFVRQNDLP